MRMLPIAATAAVAAATAACGAGARPRTGDPPGGGARGAIVTKNDAPAGYTQTIPGTSVEFEMGGIPSGKVIFNDPMDSNKKIEAEVGPLWIGRCETTWDAIDMFVYGADPASANPRESVDGVTYPSKPYVSMDRGFGKGNHPVISISYKNAAMFCAWLSAKTGKSYRLPTEAQWRFACAAGGGVNAFPADAQTLRNQAWLKEESKSRTHPAGSKAPNAFGLFDMIGNACEWAAGADGKPVALGGCYRDAADQLQMKFRVSPVAAWNASDPQIPKSEWWLADAGFVGFRIVRDVRAP